MTRSNTRLIALQITSCGCRILASQAAARPSCSESFEWIHQTQIFITRQLHPKDKSGPEQQLAVVGQYSLTTKQWTLLIAGTKQYVFQLPDNLQAAFFAQLQAGRNLGSGSNQVSLAASTQLQWQPVDWFAVVAQLTGAPAAQSSGPNSVDLGFTLTIQINN